MIRDRSTARGTPLVVCAYTTFVEYTRWGSASALKYPAANFLIISKHRTPLLAIQKAVNDS